MANISFAEISSKYSFSQFGLTVFDFEKFLKANKLNYTEDSMGYGIYYIDTSKEKEYVDLFLEPYKKKAQEAEIQRAKKDEEISKILISSGFNFDGYDIVKYSGYISGDDAIEIPRSGWLGGNNGQNLTNALVKIRRQALKELKEAALALDCNAVIGVDFDYITLEPETANFNGGTLYEPYIICVTANGNAVQIVKK